MRINLILLIVSAVFIVSCGSNKTSNNESVIEQPDTKTTVAKSNVHPGKKVYDSVCLACHMANGSGVPGMFPPLIESDFVNGDPAKLIDIVLNGVEGEIEVKGEVYNNVMPPNPNLTNDQIADVLTFVRSNFGNSAGAISPEDVQNVRK